MTHFFLSGYQDVLRKPVGFREQIPSKCVVWSSVSQAVSLRAYLVDPSHSDPSHSGGHCGPAFPSPPCLEFPKGGARTADNVPSLALIRVLLSGNPPFQGLHCLHPLTSPPLCHHQTRLPAGHNRAPRACPLDEGNERRNGI